MCCCALWLDEILLTRTVFGIAVKPTRGSPPYLSVLGGLRPGWTIIPPPQIQSSPRDRGDAPQDITLCYQRVTAGGVIPKHGHCCFSLSNRVCAPNRSPREHSGIRAQNLQKNNQLQCRLQSSKQACLPTPTHCVCRKRQPAFAARAGF